MFKAPEDLGQITYFQVGTSRFKRLNNGPPLSVFKNSVGLWAPVHVLKEPIKRSAGEGKQQGEICKTMKR